MSTEPKSEVMYLDAKKNQIASLKGPDFFDQIGKLKSAIDHLLGEGPRTAIENQPWRCSNYLRG